MRLHVAATGPRTIEAAARHADGVDFTVGAELDRLRWAVDVARGATPGAAGGAAPGELELGAYVNVAVHPDRVAAAELCRGSVAIFARFATEGARASGLSDVTRRGIEQLASGYRHDEHGESATPYAQRLDIDFIERFAVAGPAEQVRERLAAIADLGITRLIVVPGSLVADPAAIEESNARFAEAVLPDLRG